MTTLLINFVAVIYTVGIAYSVFYAAIDDEDAFSEGPWYLNTGIHVFCIMALLYSILS